jgi:hypothetical protein
MHRIAFGNVLAAAQRTRFAAGSRPDRLLSLKDGRIASDELKGDSYSN